MRDVARTAVLVLLILAVSLLGGLLWVMLVHVPVWYVAASLAVIWVLIAVMLLQTRKRRTGE